MAPPAGRPGPLFRLQWGLDNRGQRIDGRRGRRGRRGADIAALGAWQLEWGRPEVVVAVVDSGIDAGHPDLRGQILPRPAGESWDFSAGGEGRPLGTEDPVGAGEPPREGLPPGDVLGHGTHLAGIVAAAAGGAGIAGVAPGCRLLPLRIDLEGEEVAAQAAAAIRFVAQRARRERGRRRYVINGGWCVAAGTGGGGGTARPGEAGGGGGGRGGGMGGGGGHAALARAIAEAAAAEVVLVFAAGNSGQAAAYPASHPAALAVAATDRWDRLWEPSNHGAGVDLAAPGESIYSCFPTYFMGGRRPYLFRSGTSMAAAFVAGAAALVLAAAPELPAAAVRALLAATCDDVEPGNGARRLGAGRLNAARAVAAALAARQRWAERAVGAESARGAPRRRLSAGPERL